MINFMSGNILHADTEAIVNTVNCVGVMGRGIALQFKKAWPDNFKEYEKACREGEVRPGKMFVYKTKQLANPHYIINFPTKRHWRHNSRLEDIQAGLRDLENVIKIYNIRSIAIPPLGAGLGKLDWNLVKNEIIKIMRTLPDVDVNVYEPGHLPEQNKIKDKTNIPKMTAGRAVLISLIQRYLEGQLDPFITLLEVHKLLYFMQEAGEPLSLNYKKAHYGPYAENLHHVLNLIEGYFLSGFADGGDNPEKKLHLLSGAFEKADIYLKDCPETKKRFRRVSKLVDGFESSYGMELLSTVHWLKKYECLDTVEQIALAMRKWNKHKQQFTDRQIHIAYNVLEKESWFVARDMV